jgi:hypothetical protein
MEESSNETSTMEWNTRVVEQDIRARHGLSRLERQMLEEAWQNANHDRVLLPRELRPRHVKLTDANNSIVHYLHFQYGMDETETFCSRRGVLGGGWVFLGVVVAILLWIFNFRDLYHIVIGQF